MRNLIACLNILIMLLSASTVNSYRMSRVVPASSVVLQRLVMQRSLHASKGNSAFSKLTGVAPVHCFTHNYVTRTLTSRYASSMAASPDNTIDWSTIDASSTVQMVDDQRIPVKIINTEAEALQAIQVLTAHKNHVWGCDSEVADIDVKKEGPVGNGRVICVSIYGGDDVDFGNGATTLWVNNDGASEGVLQHFKAWFENDAYKKIWHNYGFDRHVMHNEGIDCRGFGGDTMHMARLWDSSRDKATGGGDGYSLEALSSDEYLFPADSPGKKFAKISMKELFGVARLKKDGGESKIKELPDMRVLQNDPATREKWIEYSARDAVATWWVREKIVNELKKMPWIVADVALTAKYGPKPNMYDFYMCYLKDFGELLTDMERNGIKLDTQVHLKQAEQAARQERQRMENMFIEWAAQYCSDTKHINIASSAQMQQLLFGEWEDFQLINRERSFKLEKSPEEIAIEQQQILLLNPYANHGTGELKALLKERGMPITGKKDDQITKLLKYDRMYKEMSQQRSVEQLQELCDQRDLDYGEFAPDDKESLIALYLRSEMMYAAKEATKQKREAKKLLLASANAVSGGDNDEGALIAAVPSVEAVEAPPAGNVNVTMPKKFRDIVISTIGLKPTDFTPTGVPQVSAAVLKKLAGKNLFGEDDEAVWGTAFEFFGKGEEGKRACRAIGALAAVGQIDATITNFLVPLQALVDKNNRIHCSLNLNTETGRLSSRRPNLQNQPALEKDQYKIRDAFIAEEGNTFIVADYGQLELRILAHISNCTSMIDAFRQGGCFHSRTAVGMYDHIKQAVANGDVMLEWDYSKGQPTVPLVKDTYGSERRKAKTLNFSIAYGKTVHGLAQDWGITKEAAQETLDAWYRDRPEVKSWQEKTMYAARKQGWVNTVMGRYRKLSEAKGPQGPAVGHALRAAINTPIQGSAADIVMMAMIKLWKSPVLKELNWKLLLQIHDEVILEGPKESMEQAMKEVRSCMENPFDDVLKPLRVHLDVDAKSADSWYKAK